MSSRLRPESRAVRVVRARRFIAAHGRTLRRRANLTLADIARDLGISISAVSLYERGLYAPPAEITLAWVAILEDLAREAAA